MITRHFTIRATALLLTLSAAHSWAATGSADDAAARCSSIESTQVSAELSKIFAELDVPAEVNEARPVSPGGSTPGFCQITGYVGPSVGFIFRLPLTRWNGKFINLGCGGICGTMNHISQCDALLKRGYACIVSDQGHTGKDGKWIHNNPQAVIDLAYRASHVTALTGKAFAKYFYGIAPKKSYFMGCSGGGREAMTEAQRFPWDFDGIIAGAPALSTTGVLTNTIWNYRAFTGGTGKALLSDADLGVLHKAVLKKCDLNDGIKDGLIADPRTCGFDAAELRCSVGKTEACLNAEQIEAVNRIYQGQRTANGKQLFPPAALPGSETTWQLFAHINEFFGDQYEALLHADPGPPARSEDYDFERDYTRLGMAQVLWEPTNPDLRAFKEAGGKLLVYTGWNDALEGVLRTVDYYETVEKVVGSRSLTQDFFRLFVIPGMDHCSGGDGAFAADYLTYMEKWDEENRAPDKLLSFHVIAEDPYADMFGLEIPTDPSKIQFSRPVYPYPTTVRYSGRGNPANAQNFAPVAH
jgi:hypothetical protein